MKNLILCTFLLLSGCSTLKGIMSLDVASYDASEFAAVTKLRTTIVEDAVLCSDSTAMKGASADINKQALELSLYSQGVPHNDDVANIEQNLLIITSEFAKRYASVPAVSTFYCDDKMAILMRSAATIQKVIGAKQK
jgi:hypothetical protein